LEKLREIRSRFVSWWRAGQARIAESAPPEFHHVTVRVRRIYPALMVRSEHQQITIMESIKMDHETATQLRDMLNEYLDNHQDGVDWFGYTMEGEFS
jgi:hypothetical protein